METTDWRDEVRYKIKDQLISASNDNLRMAWTFASIYEGSLYQAWGFKSFHAWVAEDFCNSKDSTKNIMSKSRAYDLCRVGRVFGKYKDDIKGIIQVHGTTFKVLSSLAKKVERGLPLSCAIDSVLHGSPLPQVQQGSDCTGSDPEKPRQVKVWVRKGDLSGFNTALMLYAVMHGNKTPNDAHNEIILSMLPELLGQFENSKSTFRRFTEQILNGKFKCKLCGEIPRAPTWHHLLAKSKGCGYGPVVILCERPCHYDIVQPKWRHYCSMWYRPYDEVEREAQSFIDMHGGIPVNYISEVLCD